MNKCPNCGREFKNLGSHLRHCKASEVVIEEIIEEIKDRETKEQTEYPWRITDKRIQQDPELSEEEKIKQFFLSMPKWSLKKPKGLKALLFNQLNKDIVVKACVWIQPGEEPQINFVPYDVKKECLVNPDTGEMHDPAMQGNVFFYRKDKFLPLVNCRNVSEEYDIPEHFVMSVYNMALKEGVSASDEDIIAEIQAMKRNQQYFIIAVLVVVIGAAFMFASFQDNYTSLIETFKATGGTP